jgi:flavodoxin/Fe-S-cluster-containing hydrogenase component 2
MKSIIIYFSQSGNTKKIAHAIWKGMNPLVERCDLVDIEQTDPKDIVGYDLIGIGTAYWSGPPPHVKRFIKAMPYQSGQHAFTFYTHGILFKRFLPYMIRLLVKEGLTVIGARDWYGSVRHPLLPVPYLTDGHPDEIDLKEAEDFGKELPETSKRVLAGDKDLILPIPPLPPRRTMKRIMPEKKFHNEKCKYPECTLCMDHCRMKVIDLSVSPPIFPEKCVPCFFCELICPQGAIEIDYESYAKLELKRAKKIFVKTLEEAEAKGTFRRLMPVNKVGWDTPFYRAFSKHPRWVIPQKDNHLYDDNKGG